MDTKALQIDLHRTRERLARAERLGDWTARTIGEARERRLVAELMAASAPSGPTAASSFARPTPPS